MTLPRSKPASGHTYRTYALLTSPALLWAVLSASCFTGIESTPKITASDVKRQNIVVTDEERYLSDIGPQPIADWTAGKKLIVTDSRISLALKNMQNAPAPQAGEILTFGHRSPATTITGTAATDITVTDSSGTPFSYRIEADSLPAEAEIPFTIQLDMVNDVRTRMLGNEYYILTSAWYDKGGNSHRGLKYIKVEITDVTPGNANYPIKLSFVKASAADTYNSAEQFSVLMSVGNRINSTRKFNNLFSLADPRKRYPDISPENWDLISQGRVRIGMTRDECRLSLGKASNVERINSYGGVIERWTYENGRYLIFEDGLLNRFRQ